jgi:hypothetical protein
LAAAVAAIAAAFLLGVSPARATGSNYDQSRYGDVVLADKPLGYWQFAETAGTVARDSSGNGSTAASSTARP